MTTLKMTIASFWGACVVLGCAASQTTAPVEAPVAQAPSRTLYLAAEKTPAQQSAATTKPTAWLNGGSLPAAHPAVAKPAAQDQLPAGHPDVSQMKQPDGMKGLPAGHPTVEQMQAAPATQPVTFGTLTVRAVQKTAGGPPIAGDEVTVEIYDQDAMVKKVQAKLDPSGVANVAEVPFGGTYGQFVRINHGGVEYTQQAEAGQDVSVNVYESTEEAPAWSIKMRHMIVQPTEGGVQVTDVLAVENPSDRAWLGRNEGGAERTTFALGLPAGATSVQLDGAFHDCCVKIEKDRIINTMALVPGVNKYQLTYTLLASGGKVEVATTTPALTKNMIVMVPDDGAAVSAVGLEGPSTVNMGGGNTRFFRGQEIKEGTAMKVTLAVAASGAKSAATTTSEGINASQVGRIIAGAGGLLIFVIGGMFMFLKAPKSSKRRK